MKKVVLLGSRPANHPFPVISYAIRLIEWSDISHVGVLFPDEGIVYNAHFNNIKGEDVVAYLEKHEIIHEVEIELSEKEYESMLEKCKEMEGPQKGYWTTLFGAAIPQIVRSLTGLYLPNLGIGQKGLTCSCFYFMLMQNLGEAIPSKPNFYNLTTRDAVEHAKNI